MSRVFKNKDNQVTQKYKSGYHNGIDLVGYSYALDYITAHSDGVVVGVRSDYKTNDKSGCSYGNYVKIKHDNGYYTLYAHLKYGSVNVKVGDRVTKNQVIGYMGNTGHSFGSHLHFEVRNEKDTKIDPTPYIDTDLPLQNSVENRQNSAEVEYQAYDNALKKWWNVIKNYNETNPNGYAGVIGHSMGGLRVRLTNGAKITVKSHVKGGNWLSEITKWDDTSSGYSGLYGKEIDKIMIKGDIPIKYRVHILGESWLAWVDGFDENEPVNGYAGLTDKTIDAIQITRK